MFIMCSINLVFISLLL